MAAQPQQLQQRQQYGIYKNINSLCSFTKKKQFLWCVRCATQCQDIVTTFIAWFHRNITVYGRIQSTGSMDFNELMSYTLTHTLTHAALSSKYWNLLSTRQIQEVKTRQNGEENDGTEWKTINRARERERAVCEWDRSLDPDIRTIYI